jgi:hypothetical protein
MKVPVLIVAKTHMHELACVGGLRLDTNRNVRLLQADASYQPGDTDYEVGQHWELDIEQYRVTQPPHVESVLVFRRRLIGQQNNVHSFLIERVQPWHGSPDVLFDGCLRATPEGSGYIARGSTLPRSSTGFWIPDHSLQRVHSGRGLRYKYPQSAGIRFLPYVGYAPLIDTIPAGTLVRVSLARWWRPDKNPEIEERCYLQLSGWFPSNKPMRKIVHGGTVVQTLGNTTDLRDVFPRDDEEWSDAEDTTLRQLVCMGEHIDMMVRLFQRQPDTIRNRMMLLQLVHEYQRYHIIS